MLCSFTRGLAGICVLVVSFAIPLAQTTSAVTLKWDPSADATSGSVVGYRLYYSAQSFSFLPTDVATNPAFTKIDVGNQTSAALTNLAAGPTYYFGVTAYDASGVESSLSNVLPFNDAPPAITLTSPSASLSFLTTDLVVVSATASSASSTIAKVEFFDGATLLASETAAPFTLTQLFAAGNHTLTAKATDANNNTAMSTAVSISVSAPVTPPPNALPTVSLSAPANNSSFTVGSSVTIAASATDTDGTIAKVEFYDGFALLGSDTTAPYSIAISTLSAGAHSITAKATDNLGATSTSPVALISINLNQSPTVTLTTPANNSAFLTNAAVTITASAVDSDGTIAKVEFYDSATLLGSATAPPYSVTTTNLSAGAHSITAKATDNLGAVSTSGAIAISVSANQSPAVAVTGPANNSTVVANTTVTIVASATDPDGSVARVDFYDGATLLGSATATPYTLTTTTLAVGTHSLTAVATDNLGATTTSAATTITVVANQSPTVSISSPARNSIFQTTDNIAITAKATDSDGSISKVDFLDGNVLLGTATSSPYSISVAGLTAGTHTLKAKATDNSGASTMSRGVSITVNGNSAPTVALTSPANNSTFGTGAAITITASASDSGGSVTSVDFFDGAVLLGTVTSSPYSIVTSSLAAGTHALTARATDNNGLAATSASATITVSANSSPTVALSGLAAGSRLSQPFVLSATASESNATITQVEFFAGTNSLGVATVAPYTISTSIPSGTYTFVAKATDNSGIVGVSAGISATVKPTGPKSLSVK
jgi:hypothetical protein